MTSAGDNARARNWASSSVNDSSVGFTRLVNAPVKLTWPATTSVVFRNCLRVMKPKSRRRKPRKNGTRVEYPWDMAHISDTGSTPGPEQGRAHSLERWSNYVWRDGFQVPDLEPLERLMVRTCNHLYEVIVI